MKKHFILLAGVAHVAALVPQAAFAQTTTAASDTARPTDGGLDDIVVTANKREENLNDVGLTVSAIGATEIARSRISSLEDVAAAVPGLVFSPSTANTPIFTLRGIGFNEAALAVYPAVSVYTDQVPLPFPVLATHAAYDLERIEVLKGPQGTLFGQNSTGGAVNYIVAKPTRELSAGVDLTYGRFNLIEANGFVSGPLTDNLRARIAVTNLYAGDWQKSHVRNDSIGEQKYTAGRLLLDWDAAPGVTFSLNLNGWLDRSDPQAQQYAIFQPQPPETQQVLIDFPFVPTGDARLADWSTGKYRPRSDRDFWQAALRADIEVAQDITVTSLTSYAKFKQTQVTDGDGMELSSYDLSPNDGDIWAFNQELRIGNSGNSRFTWVLGGNFGKSSVSENQILFYPVSAVNNPANNNIFQSGIYTKQDMRDIAAFGNIEFELSDAVTLKGGLRYTDSRRDAEICGYDAGDGRINELFTLLGNLLSGQTVPPLVDGDCYSLDPEFIPGAPFFDTLKENNVSWRVGADFRAAEDVLLYANVSRGFKGGSYPTVAAATFGQLAPAVQEKLTAYEAGFKATLADRAVQLNGAVFYYDYRDKQVRGKLLDPIFNLLDVLVNVPKSTVKGAELDVTLRPVSNLTFSGGVTYLDSQVDDYVGYNVLGQIQDFQGTMLPFTPKWTYSANVEYNFADLFEGGTPYVGATLSGRSGQSAVFDGDNITLSGNPANRVVDNIQHPFYVPGYATVDFRAGYDADNGFRIMGFVKNAFNRYYVTTVIPGSNTSSRYAGRPLTWGITIGYKM